MCDVRPFCGLRYNLQRIEDLSAVISPPYDVISKRERPLYHHASPYNIIRLESGDETPEDTPENNKYTRAASALNSWIREGILVRDRKPAFYIIEHRFIHDGAEVSRWDLMARLRLEDFASGNVRPHEKTTRRPAADRLMLLRSSRTNFSPIMGLFRSDKGKMLELFRDTGRKAPECAAVDRDGVKHLVRTVDEEEAVKQIMDYFREKPVYIADGHHRYETALQFMNEQDTLDTGGNEAFNFVMITLMDSDDPGIIMSPTHRLIRGLDPAALSRLEEMLSPYFTAIPVPHAPDDGRTTQGWLKALFDHAQTGAAFGIYDASNRYRVLKLRQDAKLTDILTDDEMRLWGNLDVFLLHRVIVETVLRLDIERILPLTKRWNLASQSNPWSGTKI